jgi:Holliday junction resolvase
MTNNRYIKGRAAEYQIIHRLMDEGWLVFRTAGSHGMFDIIALDSENIRLIQVKAVAGRGAGYSKKEESFIKNLAVPDNVSKEIWVKKPRKEWVVNVFEKLD